MTDGRVLHTGALLALARGSIYMGALMRWAVESDTALAVPTGALAEAWAQAGDDRYRITVLMGLDVTLAVPMTKEMAITVGQRLASTGSMRTTDAHTVALAVEHNWGIIASGDAELRSLDDTVEIDEVP